MIKYDVVLATWNGAKYLDAQIDSICTQSLLPSSLIIADDGSSDLTLSIVHSWQNRTVVPIRLLPTVPRRLGSCRTFERLFSASTAPYVMPADQDDIWDISKAEILVHKMLAYEKVFGVETPLLLHTDLRLINSHGDLIAQSFLRYQGLNPNLNRWLDIGMQNIVTGCACLFNRACLRDALPFPNQAVLHDWWLALVTARKGNVFYIPYASVNYRQHDSNVVGAKTVYNQIFQRLLNLWSSHSVDALIGPGLGQLLACHDRYPVNDKHMAQCLVNLSCTSPFKRISSAMRLNLRKHRWWRTLGFYIALLYWKPRRS